MKKLAVILLVLCCTVKGSAQDNSSKTIDGLLDYFSQSFTVTDKSEVWYQMLLAADGCRVRVNGPFLMSASSSGPEVDRIAARFMSF